MSVVSSLDQFWSSIWNTSTLIEPAVQQIESTKKMGLCCYDCKEQHFSPLTKIANWTYNYRMFPQEGFPLEWAIANKVEFVPMIMSNKV